MRNNGGQRSRGFGYRGDIKETTEPNNTEIMRAKFEQPNFKKMPLINGSLGWRLGYEMGSGTLVVGLVPKLCMSKIPCE